MTIKAARINAGLNQTEMANKLGISKVTYLTYEKYRVPMRIDRAILFSKITGVSLDDIIFLNKNYT